MMPAPTNDNEIIGRLSASALVALSKKGLPRTACKCPYSPPEVRIHLLPKYTESSAGPNSYHPYVAVFCKTCGLSQLYHARSLIGRAEFKRIVKSDHSPRSGRLL